MTKILKIKSKRPPHKGIIISAPAYVHEYMTLYCLAHGITKTKIIKGYLDEWLKEHRISHPDEVLIDMISQRIMEKYNYGDEWKGVSIEDFKRDMSLELGRNGVKSVYITAILAKLKK
jgi:hypothetical protein